MRAYVQGRVVEYLLLNHLLGLLIRHLAFHEVEGRVRLLHLDRPGQLLLLVENRRKVTVLAIVLAPVHPLITLIVYYYRLTSQELYR